MNEILTKDELHNALVEIALTGNDGDSICETWFATIEAEHEALRSSLARAEADLAAARAEGPQTCKGDCHVTRALRGERDEERSVSEARGRVADAALSAAEKMRGALERIVELDTGVRACNGFVCQMARIARAILSQPVKVEGD